MLARSCDVLYRVVQKSSCMFEFSHPLSAHLPGQPMHSPSALTERVSPNLEGFFLLDPVAQLFESFLLFLFYTIYRDDFREMMALCTNSEVFLARSLLSSDFNWWPFCRESQSGPAASDPRKHGLRTIFQHQDTSI